MKELVFVNRKSELNSLEKLYLQEGFQFVPVYGRRRIGKTRLIQEFINNKPAIYFLADAVSETEQLKTIGRAVGEFFNDTILVESGFSSWQQFFSYLKQKGNKRLIFVIDEFPYLVNSNPAISSVFQKGIDQYLKGSNIFLILMGSSVGMMEKEVLHYKAPLYGRRTASIEVHEMNFSSLFQFFPDKSFDELVRIYSVFGTIPAYIEKIYPNKDIFSNIELAILDKTSFLYNETEFILREEFREPRNYFVILRAIAQGKQKLSEIINDTGFEKSMVSRYLDILKSLRYVKKDVPVTEKNPEKSKIGVYRIYDKYFTFWFKFVFPLRRWIEIGKHQYVLSYIKENFEHHVSMLFEDACREVCALLMQNGYIQYSQIGRWWSKDAEIDIVALDEISKTVWLGECKWSNKQIGDNIYAELIKKSKQIDYFGKKQKTNFMLFSKSGFTERLSEIAKKENLLLIDKEFFKKIPLFNL
ncbi:MAG: ATP-binding protein [bacterium]